MELYLLLQLLMTIYNELIKRSAWDFDWQGEMPNKFVRYLGNIKGDWEVPDISKDVCPCGPKSYKQLEEMGSSLDNAWDYNLVDSNQHSQLYETAKVFGLEDLFVEFHVQRPGQMHPLHMDLVALGGSQEVDRSKKVIRLFVMLEDWKAGQVLMFGADNMVKWKRGDVIYFDWYNVPHGTCNFGHHDRPLLSVTGTLTEQFQKNFLGNKLTFTKENI
tara:strand:- start:39 stop:689 length:651 start_codon:yes stop_codon:yes gene_type:complete